MGADARTSVTDADGLFRGLDNVGVADASVFPTSGAHNPTLTLMAVALRNARRWVGTQAPPPAGGEIPATGRSVPLGPALAAGAAGAAAAAMARRSGHQAPEPG